MNATDFFNNKLEYETDSSDLFELTQQEFNKIEIVDTRRKPAFEKEHIKNAISLPYREMNAESIKSLDKNKLYVCYCEGVGCNAASNGAYRLASHGFKVKELIGGLIWWKKEGFPVKGTWIENGVSGNQTSEQVCDC